MTNLKLIIAVWMHRRILHDPEVCMKNIQNLNDKTKLMFFFFLIAVVSLSCNLVMQEAGLCNYCDAISLSLWPFC